MKKVNQAYNSRIATIGALSHAMRQLAVESQFHSESGAFLTAGGDRLSAINAAVANDAMFEGLDPELSQGIVTGLQSCVRNYEKTYGELPREEVMASAYQTMHNMMTLDGASDSGTVGQMMLESINQTLSHSDGVEIRAKMVGLVLPVLLETATIDAVTMMPAGANEVEIFKVDRIAGSSFGDFKKGQLIDQATVGQYSSMRQRYSIPDAQRPDGSRVIHVFKTKSDLENTKREIPFNKGSVSLFVDRVRVCRDLDTSMSGSMSGSFNDVVINCEIDYSAGEIIAKPVSALADGTEIHVEFEVDIENAPELIPTINHEMDSRKIRPAQNVIAADASIQAMFTMQREYNQDLKSMQLSHMRNTLAAEKSTRHLVDINFACTRETEFNIYVEPGEDWKLHRERLQEKLLIISNEILKSTKVVGLTGLYAGVGASTILKTLGSRHFVAPANYRQSNSIHYAGKLFGLWKVYEAPVVIDNMDILCYGRGNSHSEAGYVAGDAISATMYTHPIGANLKARNTLYELAYGEVHPFDGQSYFYRLKLTEVAPEKKAA